MSTRPPDNIPDYLFPIVMAPMSCLEVVRQYYVRTVVLFGPTPRNLRAIAMSELITLIALIAIRCCLECHSFIQLLYVYQVYITHC